VESALYEIFIFDEVIKLFYYDLFGIHTCHNDRF